MTSKPAIVAPQRLPRQGADTAAGEDANTYCQPTIPRLLFLGYINKISCDWRRVTNFLEFLSFNFLVHLAAGSALLCTIPHV